MRCALIGRMQPVRGPSQLVMLLIGLFGGSNGTETTLVDNSFQTARACCGLRARSRREGLTPIISWIGVQCLVSETSRQVATFLVDHIIVDQPRKGHISYTPGRQ